MKVVNHYYWEHTRTVLMNTGWNTLLQSWIRYLRVGKQAIRSRGHWSSAAGIRNNCTHAGQSHTREQKNIDALKNNICLLENTAH